MYLARGANDVLDADPGLVAEPGLVLVVADGFEEVADAVVAVIVSLIIFDFFYSDDD